MVKFGSPTRADDEEADPRQVADLLPAVDNEGGGYPTRHPDKGEGVGPSLGEVNAECDRVRDLFPRDSPLRRE